MIFASKLFCPFNAFLVFLKSFVLIVSASYDICCRSPLLLSVLSAPFGYLYYLVPTTIVILRFPIYLPYFLGTLVRVWELHEETESEGRQSHAQLTTLREHSVKAIQQAQYVTMYWYQLRTINDTPLFCATRYAVDSAHRMPRPTI